MSLIAVALNNTNNNDSNKFIKNAASYQLIMKTVPDNTSPKEVVWKNKSGPADRTCS